MTKTPTVVDVSGTSLPAREIVVGLDLNHSARAFPLSKILTQSPLQDTVGGTPVILIAAPDGKSVRVFLSQLPSGQLVQFFRGTGSEWQLVDSVSGSRWNFQGCAISGSA